jgi:hypothetical protein
LPEGPDNDAALNDACGWANVVAAAWGVHGAHRGRGAEAARLLRGEARSLLHLGLTQAGHPRHPLYVSYRVALTPWEASEGDHRAPSTRRYAASAERRLR